MRLRYLLRYYPTRTETFVYREIEGLRARGHAVSGVAIGRREDGGSALPDWTCVHPPDYAAVAAAAAPLLARPAGREAARWLKEHQPAKQVLKALWAASTLAEGERIHVHFAGEAAEWALLARRACGVSYGVTVHAVDLFKPRPSLTEVLQGAAVVLTVSAYNARILTERCGVEARVVRCGVDPGRWRAAHPERPGPVVAVGRWVPKKGLDLLVEAVRRVPGAQLWLVGDAPAEVEGPQVRRLGMLAPDAVAEVLAEGALFALPCRVAPDGDRDGVPVAMMEAMAAGLPVLTTTLPGLDELVDDACGWRVPPDDPDALTEAVAEVLADPVARAVKGQAARRRVAEGFTLDAQVEGMLAAWREVDLG
ncbi:MAG: glycosyltransferase family 4 protein [Alphaproteobacteria bacterium]|nr:glycosyltransferase family 4 protein [Alphaproteobacteria bacterium]